MTVTWTPTPSLPLITAQEDERNVSASVTAIAAAPDEVEQLAWTASPPLPPQAVVEAVGGLLSISIPHFGGVWPIHEIRYLQNRKEGACTAWADLPGDAEDLIAYRKNAAGMRTIMLSVTATLKEGPPATQAYRIELYPNYTPGREALQEAVDARRHPPR